MTGLLKHARMSPGSLQRIGLVVLASALLGGCVYVPLGKVPKLTAGTLAAAGTAALSVTPRVMHGAYLTQAAVSPYAPENVQHVVFALFKVEGASESAIVGPTGSPVTKDLGQAELAGSVTFTNLHPHTTYRVYAWAYQSPGTASLDLISEQAFVDVPVEADDRPAIAAFEIQLKDKPFHGEAASPIHLLPGGYATDPEDFR